MNSRALSTNTTQRKGILHGGRVVGIIPKPFVGIETSQSRNAVAIAEGARGAEARFRGEFPATEAEMQEPMIITLIALALACRGVAGLPIE